MILLALSDLYYAIPTFLISLVSMVVAVVFLDFYGMDVFTFVKYTYLLVFVIAVVYSLKYLLTGLIKDFKGTVKNTILDGSIMIVLTPLITYFYIGYLEHLITTQNENLGLASIDSTLIGFWVHVPTVALFFAARKILKANKLIAKEKLVSRASKVVDNALLDIKNTGVIYTFNEWSNAKNIPMDSKISELGDKDAYRKWLTLDEQHEYLKNIKEIIQNKYNADFGNYYLFNTLVGKSLSKVTYSTLDTELLTIQSASLDEKIKDFSSEDKEILEIKKNTLKRFRSKFTEQVFDYDMLDRDFLYSAYPFFNYTNYILKGTAIDSDLERVSRGVRGEESLEEELKFFDKRFKILTNVRVVENGVSSESDAIIVSKYGVFTVEAKNFSEDGKYSIQVAKDGKWSKLQNGKKHEMKDVVSQNNRHVMIKQSLINREIEERGLESKFIDLEGIIAITNNTVDIDNETDFPIMRLSQLYTHIRSFPETLSDEQIEMVYDILESNMQPAQKFPITDYEKVYDKYVENFKPKFEVYLKVRDLLGLPVQLN